MKRPFPKGVFDLKKQKQDVCPGCSRHCTQDCVRCKCGRAYFAGRSSSGTPAPQEAPRKKRKWEKYAAEGGLVWRLIIAALRAKKALRREQIAEAQIMDVLDEQEKTLLDQILKKLDGIFQ